MVKKILVGLLVILVIIQFIRPEKNIGKGVSANDISTKYTVSTEVQGILQKACYDCHSNNTRYPWYSNFQPVAWWLNDHIQEGKEELNFSEFGSYRVRKQYRKLEETQELVDKGEMPIHSYTFIHTDAKLTAAEKKVLIDWADGIRNEIKAKYPADSLLKK